MTQLFPDEAWELPAYSPKPMGLLVSSEVSVATLLIRTVSELSQPQSIEAEVKERIIGLYAEVIRTDNADVNEAVAQQWAKLYFDTEQEYDLDPGLMLAIGRIESEHQPQAKSGSGAYGLMQIQLPTAREALNSLNEPRPKSDKELIKQLFKPEVNIKLGAVVLDSYREIAGGDLDGALKLYSGGSRRYVAKIRKEQQKINGALEEALNA